MTAQKPAESYPTRAKIDIFGARKAAQSGLHLTNFWRGRIAPSYAMRSAHLFVDFFAFAFARFLRRDIPYVCAAAL
ncbi:MAG: hypothetical protein DBX55_00435 [Verrucomicrobia bacterium]|nr:MAG: hypothetical protein DBX55_00435 [Verrucomicrobiota bacterium]